MEGETKTLKVIQWYTGEIGRHQIRTIVRSPLLELVGAFVHHEEKNGVDAGTIAGIEPLGVIVTNDMEEILAVEADCVLYNPPTERYDEIIPILASAIPFVCAAKPGLVSPVDLPLARMLPLRKGALG